jgi:hypothetical protein
VTIPCHKATEQALPEKGRGKKMAAPARVAGAAEAGAREKAKVREDNGRAGIPIRIQATATVRTPAAARERAAVGAGVKTANSFNIIN